MKNLRILRIGQPHYPPKATLANYLEWVGVIKFLSKTRRRLAEIVELEGQRLKGFDRNVYTIYTLSNLSNRPTQATLK